MSPGTAPRRLRGGFTRLEVVAATALAALISVGALSVIAALLRDLSDPPADRTATPIEVVRALDQIAADLVDAEPLPASARNVGRDQDLAQVFEAAAPAELMLQGPLGVDARGGLWPEANALPARVSYRWGVGSGLLLRQQTLQLSDDPLAEPDEPGGASTELVLLGVRSLRVTPLRRERPSTPGRSAAAADDPRGRAAALQTRLLDTPSGTSDADLRPGEASAVRGAEAAKQPDGWHVQLQLASGATFGRWVLSPARDRGGPDRGSDNASE